MEDASMTLNTSFAGIRTMTQGNLPFNTDKYEEPEKIVRIRGSCLLITGKMLRAQRN